MLLLSADNARQFAELDPLTGKLVFFSRVGADREKAQASISGCFANVGELIAILYRDGEFLKLRLGDDEYSIDDKTTSKLHRSLRYRFIRHVPGHSLRLSLNRILRGSSRFELIRDGASALDFNYQPPLPYMPFLDPTFFVDEEEHFDFMLFIHNVMSDPTRRKEIWTDNAEWITEEGHQAIDS